MKGTIRITDKVYFEYYEYTLKAYEASKQLVEVEKVNYLPLSQSWILEPFDFLDFSLDPNRYVIINNQPCKAEIKGERAIIISLTKG